MTQLYPPEITVRAFLTRRERDLQQQIAAIKATIEGKEVELAEVKAALEAIKDGSDDFPVGD